MNWRGRASRGALQHAERYLSLVAAPDEVMALSIEHRNNAAQMRDAGEVLRDAALEPLPAGDPAVRRVKASKRAGPVLTARTRDGRHHVAAGMAALSAAHHAGEPVATVHADTRGVVMAGKKKSKRRREPEDLDLHTSPVTLSESGDRTRLRKVARTLADVEGIDKSELDAGGRDRLRKSQRELQLAYLREVSPAGAEAWLNEQRRLGHM